MVASTFISKGHMTTFYHLTSLAPTPCILVEEYPAGVIRTDICPGCYELLPTVPLPVFELAYPPEAASLNFIREASIRVMSTEFLRVLGEIAEAELETQVLLDPQGHQIAGFMSVRAKRKVLVRGNRESTARKCNTCGRQLYYPKGRWYVLQREVEQGDLFGSQFGFVLTDTLYDKVTAAMKLRKAGVLKLRVRDLPVDGLGVDPHDRIMEFYKDWSGRHRSRLVDKP
jgi:hypothetical protein